MHRGVDMKKPQKTLEYWIARFDTDSGKNLQELVREAWDKFDNHIDRSFLTNKGHSYRGLYSSKNRYSGFAIQCAQYTVDQPVGIISDELTGERFGMESPPDNKQYVSADLMAYIKENRIVCLNCGPNANRLASFLKGLFDYSDVGKVENLLLSRGTNIDKLALIREFKVKGIEFNVALTRAMDYKLKKDRSPKDSPLKSAVKEITGQFIDDKALEEEISKSSDEYFRVKIEALGFGRGVHPVLQNLDEVAKEVIDDDDEDYESVAIRLRNNTVIKSSEVSAKTSVPILSNGNSVNVTDAWKKMDEYMNEIETNYIKGRGKK